ncbi:MAG TPA: tRNA lysidine(34) synthetase TilS [Polyangia bacterium]|nr:tRNA lysidine(34) synthetase TilS [Polyangia bacterium]
MSAVETIRRRIARALERAPLGRARVLVACSGGPDSRTLLDALHALGVSLEVACVDHRLRAESAGEAARVVEAARALGVEAAVLPVEVRRPTPEAARHARYRALVEHARARNCDVLAVGHTATDQAETLLDRLIRGAGTRGLSAMAPSRRLPSGIRLVRPMLDVSADEIAAYVAERGLDVARDPTNADLRFRRSRLRHEVLPLLRRERPDLDRALAALCDRLRADADALDAETDRARDAVTAPDGSLDAAILAGLAEPIAARLILRLAAVERVHIEAVLKLCADLRGTRSVDLPGGLVAERRYGRLHFHRRACDPGDVEIPVPAPGRYRFLDEQIELGAPAFAAARAPGATLWLRNVRPGDRLRLGERLAKVQDVMVDAKIPRPERRRLPLLVRRGSAGPDEVLWIPGVRPCADSVIECALTREGAVQ